MRAIVCTVLGTTLLCTAPACGTARAQPPSVETIVRGKALVDAADCASCHTADPAKPLTGGN